MRIIILTAWLWNYVNVLRGIRGMKGFFWSVGHTIDKLCKSEQYDAVCVVNLIFVVLLGDYWAVSNGNFMFHLMWHCKKDCLKEILVYWLLQAVGFISNLAFRKLNFMRWVYTVGKLMFMPRYRLMAIVFQCIQAQPGRSQLIKGDWIIQVTDQAVHVDHAGQLRLQSLRRHGRLSTVLPYLIQMTNTSMILTPVVLQMFSSKRQYSLSSVIYFM